MELKAKGEQQQQQQQQKLVNYNNDRRKRHLSHYGTAGTCGIRYTLKTTRQVHFQMQMQM